MDTRLTAMRTENGMETAMRKEIDELSRMTVDEPAPVEDLIAWPLCSDSDDASPLRSRQISVFDGALTFHGIAFIHGASVTLTDPTRRTGDAPIKAGRVGSHVNQQSFSPGFNGYTVSRRASRAKLHPPNRASMQCMP